jgi:hypothetical protein
MWRRNKIMTAEPEPKIVKLPPAKPKKADLVFTRVCGSSAGTRVAGSHTRPNRFN